MKKRTAPSLRTLLNNDRGFAIIIFALVVAVLIGFGIANIDLGADKRSKATTANIMMTKVKKELNRHLRLETLKIQDRLLKKESATFELVYHCSTTASIKGEKSYLERPLKNKKSVLFI